MFWSSIHPCMYSKISTGSRPSCSIALVSRCHRTSIFAPGRSLTCLRGRNTCRLAPSTRTSGSVSGTSELLSEKATGTCDAITVETRNRDGNGSKFGVILYGMSIKWSSILEVVRRVSGMGWFGDGMRPEKGGITRELTQGSCGKMKVYLSKLEV